MSDPAIVLRGVTKSFGNVRALRGVDLEVGSDELLVVLGPTGAGKTTLLRTIVGLEAPDAGSIVMGGTDITNLSPPDRDMALVFQNFSLYPEWTVRRNLEFPLRAPGRAETRSDVEERINWAADMLGITHLLDRRAVQLSGGEMQRVTIGRAIVRRPKLFLMDEPLTNLDAKLREKLRVELAVLRRGLGTPMIFVTHDQAEALSMADRVVVLCEGSILQAGTPEEVYTRPASPTVALQLGQPPINVLDASSRSGMWTTASGVALLPADAAAGQQARIGIRPEEIALSGGSCSATVKVVENMGAEKILLADWQGNDIHILAPKTSALRPGNTITPAINPARATVWICAKDDV